MNQSTPMRIYLLLISIALLASCSRQAKPGLSNGNQTTDKLPSELVEMAELDAFNQISQYVVEIYEDRHGHLWFGTMAKGAARFDGKTLTYFSEKDGMGDVTVSSFAEDKEGNLWFGTHEGISKYDGKTFTNYLGGWSGVQSDAEGNIWVGSHGGVAFYDGSNGTNGQANFTEFPLPIDPQKIMTYAIRPGSASLDLVDHDGNLWFGTDGYGAFKYDGEYFTHFSTEDGLCSNNITSIIEDQQGRIWFTCMQSYQPAMTGDGGVCRYDRSVSLEAGEQAFTTFPEIEGLSENDIYSIYCDTKGDIWIGATGFGLYQFDGDKFKVYKGTDRMDLTFSFGVQGILEDKNGTLWLGFSGGLFRLEGDSIKNVTKSDLME
jgi:ligand-binding sensor domain-containing protein